MISPAQPGEAQVTISVTMGDTSPKNIHKKQEQQHEKTVEKVQHKHENAEVQHHPHSGHPPKEEPAAELTEAEKIEKGGSGE